MRAKSTIWRLSLRVKYAFQFLESQTISPLLSARRPGAIAMFHMGRSGSTVLGDLRHQHSRIYWDGEIYYPPILAWRNPGRHIDDLGSPVEPISFLRHRIKRSGRKFYGCEIKLYHLRALKLVISDYIAHLKQMGFDYSIILERKNYLRKIVSSVLLHQKSQYIEPPGQSPVQHRIYIDPSRVELSYDTQPLMAFLTQYQDRFESLKTLLKHEHVLYLTYEDDVLDDPLVGSRRVCEFLDIPVQSNVRIRYGQVNPFPLPEIVTNFDDIERLLRGTEFDWMIDA